MLTHRNKQQKRNNFRLPCFWVFEDEPLTGDLPEDGISTTVSTDITPRADAAPAFDWNTVITDEYKEKEHFKNILGSENPGAELVKQLDNAQTLIGKKSIGVPAADASDEDWEKFFSSTRPEKEDLYEIAPLDVGEDKKELADAYEKTTNEEYMNGAKAAFFKAGLTPKQAKIVSAEMKKVEFGMFEKAVQAEKDLEAHFDTIYEKSFGNDKNKALKTGRDFLELHASEKTKEYIKGLPNEALILIADLAKSVETKYTKGDSLVTTPGKPTSADTLDSIDEELQALMKTDAYQSSFDPKHESTMAQVKELVAKKVALMQGK